MEHAPAENSQHCTLSTSEVDHHLEDKVPNLPNNEDTELDITVDEIRRILEVIAATGKFWHNWDMLKALLSFWLKQVLAEYPEAQMVSSDDGQHQSSLSGETYPDLVKRLDEALLSFIEGPPFTLQRLCEILLDPKGTYRSLSKLALALEKNLLVTSTLRICTDPYPRLAPSKAAENTKITVEPEGHSAPIPNGVETMAGDADEEMVEAESDEATEISHAEVKEVQVADTAANDTQNIDTKRDDTQNIDTKAYDAQNIDSEAKDAENVDTEMQEEKVNGAAESYSEPSSEPDPSIEPCTASDQDSSTPRQP